MHARESSLVPIFHPLSLTIFKHLLRTMKTNMKKNKYNNRKTMCNRKPKVERSHHTTYIAP